VFGEYQLLFERNPIPFWVFHRDTLRILEVNAAAVSKYGYTREQFLEMTIADIRPPEDVAAALDVAHQPAPIERQGRIWRHRRRDGSLMKVSVSSVDIDFRGEPARLVMALDVTEQLRDRERIELSEQRFQLVAHATSDAVFDWNVLTGESWRTATFGDIFGYSEAAMPHSIFAWRDQIHPEDLPRVDAKLAEFFASDATEWQDT